MPNWCMNDVEISGPKQKITDLFNTMIEESAVFEVIAPIKNWDRSTANEQWGTKWDVEPSDLTLEDIDDELCCITGMFDTAWTPPLRAFKEYQENNPDVDIHIKYYEPGLCFIGEFDINKDNYYEFDPEDLSTIDDIPEDLVAHFNLIEELDAEKLVEY